MMLSPSEPPGRESILTLTSGLTAVKAAIIAFALFVVLSPLSTRKVIDTLPAAS